jgi:hypothetical protein
VFEALLLKAPWLAIVGKAIKAVFAFLFRWVEVPAFVIIGLLAALGWYVLQVNSLHKTVAEQALKIEDYDAALKTCRENSAANVEGIFALQRRLVECAGNKAALEQANEELSKVQGGYATAMQREIARMREERDGIYRTNQSCAAHRVQPVCSPLDGRLRQISNPR